LAYTDKALCGGIEGKFIAYVFVESEQLCDYFEAWKDRLEQNNIVLVSIPGTRRGIWFARTCIMTLHLIQRYEMAKAKVAFD